ncbi:MAG: ABC transporter, partial [Gammaproteobacteria bacterium]
MDISHTSTRHLKQQNILFIILFISLIGLLAFLSNRYIYLADWTVNNQNSLNEISLKLLETLEAPVEIVSYTSNSQIKQSVQELVKRYQRIKPDITLTFVDPNSDPDTIRSLNIAVDGEMVISYDGRQENLSQLSEQDLSNTLHRLIRAKERKLFFIQGHGERSPERQANFDLSSFSNHLTKQGFLVQTLNLAGDKVIPDDTSILVIAGPQAAFLPGEVSLVIDYVNTGGNLLWLGEPLKVSSDQPMHGLLPLAELLGIEFLDGVVVDPTTQQYDIARPDYAIVTEYPRHAINDGFSTVTLFPQAAGIERLPGFLDKDADKKDKVITRSLSQPFEMTSFLTTIEQSWIETSPLKDKVHYSELLDIIGPITIGMVLSRKLNAGAAESADDAITKEQRIIIMGDGDFLSNTFLGNAGNLNMGMNIFNWLSHDEQFISIPTRIKDDIILDISPAKLSLLGTFFLLVIP